MAQTTAISGSDTSVTSGSATCRDDLIVLKIGEDGAYSYDYLTQQQARQLAQALLKHAEYEA